MIEVPALGVFLVVVLGTTGIVGVLGWRSYQTYKLLMEERVFLLRNIADLTVSVQAMARHARQLEQSLSEIEIFSIDDPRDFGPNEIN